MMDKDYLRSEKFKEQQWRADDFGAHPDVLEFRKRFVARFFKMGVPVFATEIVRSHSRQTELYVQGHSKARPGQSPHQTGKAVDIVHGRKAWALEKVQWDIFGHVGKEISIQMGVPFSWGGDFSSLYDPAHWELTGWRMIPHPDYSVQKNDDRNPEWLEDILRWI